MTAPDGSHGEKRGLQAVQVSRSGFLGAKLQVAGLAADSMVDTAERSLMKPSRDGHPSAPTVSTTLQKTIVPDPISADAEPVLPCELTKYEQNGYGKWSYGPGLEAVKRLDLMPAAYDGGTATAAAKLLRFFAITDIHITDVQSPSSFGFSPCP